MSALLGYYDVEARFREMDDMGLGVLFENVETYWGPCTFYFDHYDGLGIYVDYPSQEITLTLRHETRFWEHYDETSEFLADLSWLCNVLTGDDDVVDYELLQEMWETLDGACVSRMRRCFISCMRIGS